jgi:hypothetical protein
MLPKVVVAEPHIHWVSTLGEVVPGLETAQNLVPDEVHYLA